MGIGFTIILYVNCKPGQMALPDVDAMALKLTVIGRLVVFVRVCDGMDVVPLVIVNPLIPEGEAQSHEIVAPVVSDERPTREVGFPEQIV